MEIKAHVVSQGLAEGDTVVYRGPFSFTGDVDPETGCFAAGHPLAGITIVGKILVFTTARGSSSGSIAAWEAVQRNKAPAAMVCLEADSGLACAAITADIPLLDRLEESFFEKVESGDRIRVDAYAGLIHVMEKRDPSVADGLLEFRKRREAGW